MKKIFRIIFLVLLSLIIYNWQILKYAVMQGYGQVSIIYNSIPIHEALANKKLSEEKKNKLKMISLIKRFAIDSLHLAASDNYEKVYLPDSDEVKLMVINASNSLKLEDYIWHYPVIGDASYKGFFNKSMMNEELLKLKKENLDIDIGRVEAWSTLGWFNDPLMGSMLDNDISELSAIIIHELFHGTVYVKGNSELNENLAEFVGIHGAKAFLKSLKNIKVDTLLLDKKKAQEEAFNMFMHTCAKQLENLYNMPITDKEKLKFKNKLLVDFCADLMNKNIFEVEKNRLICKRILSSKNAFFTGFLTYKMNNKDYLTELNTKYNGNIKLFIEHYKSKYQS